MSRRGGHSQLQRSANALTAALLIAAPLWRHRVLIHRPPEAIHFALHDFMAYTSDYVTLTLLVVGWAVVLKAEHATGKLDIGPWFVTGPMVALLALTGTSALWAVDPAYAAYQALRLVIWMALYILLINLAVPTTWLAVGVAGSVLLQAAAGIGQVLVGRSLGLQRWGELALDPTWSGISVVITDTGRHLRAYGLTQHPNLLGGLIGAFLLLLVGLGLGLRRGTGVSRPPSAILHLAFAAGALVLLLTFSRGAWLAAGVGGVVLLILLPRTSALTREEWSARLLPFVAIGGIVTATFLVTQWELLRPRLGLSYAGAEVRSVDERATLIAGARALRQLRPWTGVGAGGFSTALYELAPDAIAAYPIFQPVHRVPLLLATELGPLGGSLWTFLMVAPLAALLSSARGRSADGWLAALTAIPISFFTVGWFEAYPWSSHQGALTTFMILGFWVQAYRKHTVTLSGSCEHG
jgi:hypothetical protein